MQKLEKGPIPLWYQLENLLKSQINNREILPGELLPTEMELCENYGISRATVRQAIKSLEDNGLIRREQGRGTTVLEPSEREKHVKLYGSIRELFKMGSETHLEFDSRKLILPNEELIRDGSLKPNEKVYLYDARRIVTKPRSFWAIVHFFVPRHLGAKLPLKQIRQDAALIKQIEQATGSTTHRVNQVVKVEAAGDQIARKFEIKNGSPILRIKRVYLDNKGDLIQSAVSYIADPHYEFTIEMYMSA